MNELTARMLQIAESDLEPVPCPPDWTKDSRRVADTSRVQLDLQWSAETSIDDGLSRVWQWMRSNPTNSDV